VLFKKGPDRISLKVVSVRDGSTLWAEKFDEKFMSIFAIEDSISETAQRFNGL
jgi:TolB-like protein